MLPPHIVQPFSSPTNHTFSRSTPDVWCKKSNLSSFKTLDCLLALVFSSGNSNANVVFNAGPSLAVECKPEEKRATFRLACPFFFSHPMEVWVMDSPQSSLECCKIHLCLALCSYSLKTPVLIYWACQRGEVGSSKLKQFIPNGRQFHSNMDFLCLKCCVRKRKQGPVWTCSRRALPHRVFLYSIHVVLNVSFSVSWKFPELSMSEIVARPSCSIHQ